MGVYKDGET